MVQPVTINVGPGSQPQTFTIQLEQRPPSWTDFAIYAPTVPGLVVAVLGLWVAHRFAVARDRRKEIADLKEFTKDALTAAQEACVAAWMASPEESWLEKLMTAKGKLQELGIAATDLRRRTKQGWITDIQHVFIECPLAVDIIHDIARLSNLATNDPFDDPQRQADNAKAEEFPRSPAKSEAASTRSFISSIPELTRNTSPVVDVHPLARRWPERRLVDGPPNKARSRLSSSQRRSFGLHQLAQACRADQAIR
ncbi:hypothetical protein H8B02_12870 [Bradyrhizobium sp. Pear77]|uniref:hypothetical protein n=1 Tax=Bradyrhizobium altum TaxID=1571202 RepID=UPI001E55AC7C|nr:hypothetical protein [Bradyrhizobium altum]MCC8954315.1 hypothetical protein [Bradyrhizobium altum]